MSTTKFVECLDAPNSALKQGAVYEVLSEDNNYYLLKNNYGYWGKDRFVEVPTPKTDKYVRCIDNIDCHGELHYGTIYQVTGETDNDYILAGVGLSWDKDRFVAVPQDKYVRCVVADWSEGELLTGTVYQVAKETPTTYTLVGLDRPWKKDRFCPVTAPNANKDASMPEPRTNKYVRCIQDVAQDTVRWVQLNAGSVYQVALETDHYYNLVGIDYPWSKSNFIEVPKPKKVYQHSRKAIINQLKDLSNTLVGRATFGRVHSLEFHETEIESVQQDLNDIIAQLEQIKEME
jgi:hypothetical protein